VVSFEEFAEAVGRRVRAGLIGAYGVEVGSEAAAEALAYAWEHWPRVSAMANPGGYLYRVGQTAARRARRPTKVLFPAHASDDLASIEPGLLPALQALPEMQRVCVVLVYGYGFGQTEAAELIDVSPSTVRTHLERGMRALRATLEVARDRR